MASRVFVLRHVERDKSNTADPQTPTQGGEITAFAMGRLVRRTFDPHFVSRTTSPQPRSTRTDQIFCAGLAGWEGMELPLQTTDSRLNDCTTDPRDTVQTGVKEAKALAQYHGLEPEQALFLCDTGRRALAVKIDEVAQVIIERSLISGDHLMCGLHGGATDGVFARLARQLQENVSDGMGAFGRPIGKVEGFVALYDDDAKLVELVKITQPGYLETLATVVK